MAKSRRKQAEEAIAKAMLSRLEPSGFCLVDKEPVYFEKRVDNVKWALSFYLTGVKNWSLFNTIGIRYPDLTQIMNDLLAETELAGRFKHGVGDWTSSTRLFKLPKLPKISSMEEVEYFADIFLKWVEEFEQKYWVPQSSPHLQMEGFKKFPGHWINGDLDQNVALWVSHGIQQNNREEVKYGIERGENMIAKFISINSNYKESINGSGSIKLIEILKDKLKGYLDT